LSFGRQCIAINAEWQKQNKMPENPTDEQRFKWHLEHAQNCNCRPIAGNLLEETKARGRV
jgi:hypothetical protein